MGAIQNDMQADRAANESELQARLHQSGQALESNGPRIRRPLKWFMARIGKRIWRRSNRCPCGPCRRVTKEGLTPFDARHARYVFDCACEFGITYYDAKPKGGK